VTSLALLSPFSGDVGFRAGFFAFFVNSFFTGGRLPSFRLPSFLLASDSLFYVVLLFAGLFFRT